MKCESLIKKARAASCGNRCGRSVIQFDHRGDSVFFPSPLFTFDAHTNSTIKSFTEVIERERRRKTSETLMAPSEGKKNLIMMMFISL